MVVINKEGVRCYPFGVMSLFLKNIQVMGKKIINLSESISLMLVVFALSAMMSSCGSPKVEVEPFSDSVERDIEILSSDEFEGRAPATPGGIRARDYIRERFTEIGLKPGNGDSFLQAVPLVEVDGSDFSPLRIDGSGFSLSFDYLDDMIIGSYRLEDRIDIDGSEMVFVGYGVVAPEYGWNDYEGIDVEGKTVVILVNDPGFATGDDEIFTGRAMTYYGRWTYKFEEAARQGATAALIVHQTEPASYGWDVVRNSWSGTQYGVVTNGNIDKLPAEGWIQEPVAERIFSEAGLDFHEAAAAAASREFRAIALGTTASMSFNNSFKHSECHNVIGYIEGADYPEETVIYMAHWDHLGMVETESGVDIYNGAVDNATGVAALFAIAERFMAGEAPGRSVVFMAVTAEESGLLGSRFYSENPLFPIETTVAGINMDGLNVYGPTHDVISVGYGFSELEEYLKRHAADQSRVVNPNPYPERGYYYRSDHFNMARMGVPMLYTNGGKDFIGKDEEYTRKVEADWAARYHMPTDVIHDMWNFDGIHQDLWLFYNIGKEIANSDSFPNWVEGNEFRAVRDVTQNLRRR